MTWAPPPPLMDQNIEAKSFTTCISISNRYHIMKVDGSFRECTTSNHEILHEMST